jgi:nucleolar protein 4
VILPNTPSASLLTPTEVERRTSSFNARRALLKSNPSLFISKTRLSVRQIPTFVTERMLKRLAGHAVKAFNADIKRGERAPLTADELAADEAKPEAEAEKPVKGDGEEDKQKQKKKKFTGTKDPLVKQTKIIRQAERVDPLTGKGKSKGYGFIELTKHSDALRFLRWANNNPEVGELFSAWWKDEVEHLLKMAKEGVKSQGKDNKESKEKPEEDGVDKEREEERIKRLKAEMERQGDGDEEGGPRSKKAGSKGTLIVEFSIENIQVLQRRDASMHKSKHHDKSSVYLSPVHGTIFKYLLICSFL